MRNLQNIKKIKHLDNEIKKELPYKIGPKGFIEGGKLYKNSTIIEYNKEYYIVSDKAILTFTCTSKCNANCVFCYNKITYTPENEYIDCKTKSFNDIIEFCKVANIKMVAFSGGEPTINAIKLLETLSACNSIFRHKRLHTNGSLLKEVIFFNNKKKKLWEHLKDNGITDISISIAHYDYKKNLNIMKLNYNINIEEILKEVSSKMKLRLSCYMHSNGIKDDEILKYIEWGKKLGVKEFIFRFSTGIPNEFAIESDCKNENDFSQGDISRYKDILLQNEYKLYYNQNKTDSELYMFSKEEIKVDLDKSSEELDSDIKVRRLLYMPNNKIYTSWIDEESLLF